MGTSPRSLASQEPCAARCHMNKRQGRAYRHLLSGSRYHLGEISGLAIGMKRTATLRDLKRNYEKLKLKAEYHTDSRIEYFATWVNDYNEEKGGWRRHAHLVWTSKETDHKTLLRWLEESAGEQCSLWIDRNIEKSAWKLGYCLQYNAKQKGESVRFSMSRGWLPTGYLAAWQKINQENDQETRGAKICILENWIDLQRVKYRDWSQQTELRLDIGERRTTDKSTVLSIASLKSDNPPYGGAGGLKHPFIKRKLGR